MAKRIALAVVMLLAIATRPARMGAAKVTDGDDLTRYVNPFIGTDNGAPDYGLGNAAGDTPPGAAFPFGMVLWSPDTTTRAGGYRYFQNTIKGFSLTHFSGRGVSCYQDVPIMPTLGPLTASPGTGWALYGSAFSHGNEWASPGSYGVVLDSYGIQADLTVTPRTGFGAFTFPASDASTLLINAGGSANGNGANGTGVAIVGTNELTGSAVSGNCGGSFTYKIYFAVRFDQPFTDFGTWSDDTISPQSTSSDGARSGAYLVFDTTTNPVVNVKVGLSFVSAENAGQNLENENPGWDIEAVRSGAAAAWNSRLGAIRVRGGTDDEKTVFYTALYHALIHPSVFSDSNGQYIGFDNQIHQADGFTQYHNFAGWDNYRSEMPLLATIAPEASDMMQSLVNDAQQDPSGGLPRWQHANTNSGGMVGDSQDVVIATAYAFGATSFDAQGALMAMDKGASVLGTRSAGHTVREGLSDYLNLGYVSTSTGGSAARTLEYVNDDFAISQFAQALGDTGLHDLYLARAQNWRTLFQDGYVVPRNPDGSFISFDPASGNGFVESSGAQYVWMVPFNLRGLLDAMGGNDEAVQRLDSHFTELNAGPHSQFAFMGNEPELKAPWVYDFAGAPWRAQDVVRRILLELYGNSPGGMPGNDDGGAMGSYVVFSAIGLFPEIPGVAGFVVGSPLFDSITVHLANGNILEIAAPGASDVNRYVQDLSLNGCEHNSPWIPWDAVSGGATLNFSLGDTPNTQWGSDPSAAPPSFDTSSSPGITPHRAKAAASAAAWNIICTPGSDASRFAGLAEPCLDPGCDCGRRADGTLAASGPVSGCAALRHP
jgi:predicted alpha-1,2-mannosidase